VKVVACYSIKGGVGKTSTAVNLAYEASRRGIRVLLWDLDPQGAATYSLRVKAGVQGGAKRLAGSDGALRPHIRATDYRGLFVIPADFSLRNLDVLLDDRKRSSHRIRSLLGEEADRFDLAILDCAPGLTLVSESVFAAADALLVPVVPTPLSQRTLEQLGDFLRRSEQRPVVMPFASMVDRRKSLHRELAATLARTVGGFLSVGVPNASAIEQMGVVRAPVGVAAPRSAAAVAYRELWTEVAGSLWS
jgi:chromosome partitioning protein